MALRPLSDDEQARVDAQIAAHPHLEVRGTRSAGAQAAHNVRRLLKERFPLVPFRVRLDRSAWAVDLQVSWPLVDGAPDAATAKALLAHFGSQGYDGTSESTTFDSDPERMAFRRAFGGVSYLTATPHPPSPEEMAAWLRKAVPEGRRTPRLRTRTRM